MSPWPRPELHAWHGDIHDVGAFSWIRSGYGVCPAGGMARQRRYFPPNSCHHIVQRGNNRCAMFRADDDRELFLLAVAEALAKFPVALHAYVLMTTHVHLIATTSTADGISRVMQSVGRRYVHYFNRRYERTGGLFEGRFRAFAVESDDYWFSCMRYVEANPIRAGIVETLETYRWSSHRALAYGEPDELITPHRLYLGLGSDQATRQRAWQAICDVPMTAEQLSDVLQPSKNLQP